MQTLCVLLPPSTGRAFDLFQIYYTDLFRDKERLTMFPPYFTFQNHCETVTVTVRMWVLDPSQSLLYSGHKHSLIWSYSKLKKKVSEMMTNFFWQKNFFIKFHQRFYVSERVISNPGWAKTPPVQYCSICKENPTKYVAPLFIIECYWLRRIHTSFYYETNSLKNIDEPPLLSKGN